MNALVRSYPHTYYSATARLPPSFEPLAGKHRADVCVVGGGFTGISTALHLAERGYDVTVLESQRIGWGASGRNGGQVGSGQRLNTLELEARVGRDAARRLWGLSEEAKALVAGRIAQHGIECDYRPGNLMAITKKRYLRDVEAETDNLASHYGYDQIELFDQERMALEVASPRYVGGCMDHGGGHLHPLNLALGMAEAARATGARLYEGSAVERIHWQRNGAVLHTAHGEVEASHVALCGNGYLGNMEPAIASKIMPIINHVAATEPLGEARARGLIRSNACVHATKFVVDYFRFSADHRLLFGGGETYSPTPLSDSKGFVRRYMLAVFPQLADVRMDFGWSGNLAITVDRMPHFARVGPHGYCAQGFSGHGVALTQVAGKLLAEAIAGTAERFDVMARIAHRDFPGGKLLRHPLLVAGMLYYALRDRL